MKKLILASWKDSTKSQYDTYLKQWESFCRAQDRDVLKGNFALALEFLYQLYHKGLSYSAINTARSALSSVLPTKDGVEFGMHKLVCRFMKGVFNVKPSLPKYASVWDPDVVLRFLKRWTPRSRLTLKQLTLKITMLLSLLTSQRAQTLHLMKLSGITFTSDRVQIVVDALLKTSCPTWHLEPIVFEKYDACKSLCIFRYLKTYIDRTSTMRTSENQLLVSYMKPHKAVTKSTVSRWIRTVMSKAGVDVSIFKAHSTRAASSSKASHFVSIDRILKAGGWKSSSCYVKHYKLPTSSKSLAPALLQNM